MTRKIEYYFSMLSPWAYIGHDLLLDISRRHNVELEYKPVALGELFSVTGGQPLPQRHISRQNYRWMELQRWREKRSVALNLKPKFWPFAVELADRTVIAIAESGQNPASFVKHGMHAVWAEDRDLSDRDTIRAVAETAGLPGENLLASAEQDWAKERYESNRRSAEKEGCFGSPTYILDGEVFWGQDRLELLDECLASGREPFQVPT